MNLVELPNGTFTKRELERLIAYRAAVAAGFYTDQDGSADPVEPIADPAEVEVAQAEVEAGGTPAPPTR